METNSYILSLCAVLMGLCGIAHAADYPIKSVRVITGFPAGSGVDIVARVVGQKLSEAYAQQFIIDSRPGASSNIATALAAKSAPDGYTLFMGTVANTINATLYAKLPFDFTRDFAPITLKASAPNLLLVHPSVPAHNVAELVKLAKAQPGKLSFGSSGTGTLPHLAGELFKSMAGVDIVHIPYKGGPLATTDLIGGQFAILFAISSTVLPHVKSGRIRALAIATPARMPYLPEVPTVAESGLPGYEAVTWFGFTAPANTPRDIIAKLNTDILKVIHTPDVRQQFAAQGIDATGSTPEQFAAYIRSEIAKWARAIKASGARAEQY
jgi:tripartite-type tricarboxylate transporter receptor subunit TctC